MYWIKKIPVPAEKPFKSFWTSDMTSEDDILMYFLMYFCHNSSHSATLLSFTAITDHPRVGEVPPGCGQVRRQSKLQSVSGPGLCTVRGGGFLGGHTLSLFLSVLILLHHSGQISETAALYYIPAKSRERWVYISWKRGQNSTDPGTWRTSRTPVQLGFKHVLGHKGLNISSV
jgi:hypothetical protein